MNRKKILLFSLFIILIPYLIVNFFIRNDEIVFNFSSNSIVRVYRNESSIVESIPIEEYIVGVVAGEMPINFENEALKAQAVASRSYVMYRILKNANKDYDVVDSVNDQVYIDTDHLKEKWGTNYLNNINKVKKAVLDTAGEYLEYDGNIVEALFFSTSVGSTENSEDIFSSQVPYLRSVSSTWDEMSPVYSDSKEFDKDEFYQLLGLNYQQRLDIVITKYTSTGRVLEILINNKKYSGREVCSKLKLRSTFFEIVEYDNKIIVNTKGYGHGVGLSQYGAQGMALEGYNYEEILKHYYLGVEIKKY